MQKKRTLLIAAILSALLLLFSACGKEDAPPTTIEALPPPEEMVFTPVEETVTAKDETNLRNYPGQGEESQILYTLKNGETAQRTGICDSGWSMLEFQGMTCYAVSSFLTTDLNYTPPLPQATEANEDGIQTEFDSVSESVTAKSVVNLRTLPGVDNPDSQVIAQLQNGEVAERIGVSSNGWSKLNYQGEVCYAVSSYLTTDLSYREAVLEEEAAEGITTRFVTVNEPVTAKVEVNLRTVPSVTDERSEVIKTLKNGEIVTRTGINEDVGWSRVEWEGQVLYCVSSYLTVSQN